ncbi:hypothetical protein [Paenibacillus oleatilyticus]|uniref:hypothetical protein n=1 Tax=Paenibacillus oleatilyticus TaxID=2594886 RepID=UPI001C20111B|nr:hypothetical protein [Paenibacillus oleatilyticus]MBU7315988.1 hypothetical protein [Paenibacillus oleatilyticus]
MILVLLTIQIVPMIREAVRQTDNKTTIASGVEKSMFSIYFNITDGAMYNEQGQQISIEDLIKLYEENGGKVERTHEPREVVLLDGLSFIKKKEMCEVLKFNL